VTIPQNPDPYQDPYRALPQDPYQAPQQNPYQAPYQDPYLDPTLAQPIQTGQMGQMGQWSDKSKVTAGLLQLVPGFLMGLGGIGRLYAGHTALGAVQLGATLFGWLSFWCGFFLVVPFFLFIGVWFWFVIDGIVLLAGRPVDGQGRLLRS
jgi:hypothetical protein